ncbi:hypothetical protein EC844_12435 [Acinetobacter calcoaceticus]|uniref:Uncharacterized protein n=1 Tax=Acinetobacter calcoaceticus TaxID=471 RepID=A0A4R1XFN7_ACICA|nr:hypothetical protein EC844_12435 [Acinetobacter calcoaceticus]
MLTICSVIFILIFFGPYAYATQESADQILLEKKQPAKEPNETVSSDGVRDISVLMPKEALNKAISSIESIDCIDYINIEDAAFPEDIKKEIYNRSDNLKTLGSFSKGEITHEFVNTQYYQHRLAELGGIDKITAKLSFKTTDLSKILRDYELICSDYSGSYQENKGFNAILKSYRNEHSSIEINELLLNKGVDKIIFFKENINTFVNAAPATFEKVGSDIYNVGWVGGSRLFTLSTQGLSAVDALRIAQEIDANVRE